MAKNKDLLQNVINDYYSRDGSRDYLNIPTGRAQNIYVTDNVDSDKLSSDNKKDLKAALGTDGEHNGLNQNSNSPALTIYINANPIYGKPLINTLIHEIGHSRWLGLGTNKKSHDPLFYRLLDDTLKLFGINPDRAQDLNQGSEEDLQKLRSIPSPAGNGDPRKLFIPRKTSLENSGDTQTADNECSTIISSNSSSVVLDNRDVWGNFLGTKFYNFDNYGIKDSSYYKSNGTHSYIYYENREQDLTRGVEHFYDTNNTVTKRIISNLDGSLNVLNIDPYNQTWWSTHEENYDYNNNLLSHVINIDDGSRDVNTYDPYNLNSWSWHGVHYDQNGQPVRQVIFNRDGTQDVNYQDRYNQQGWTWYNDHIDTAGRRISQNIFLDDGSRRYIVYDEANEFQWRQTTEIFDSSGKKVARVTDADDNQGKIEYFNNKDQPNNPFRIDYFDSNNQHERQQNLYYSTTYMTNEPPTLSRIDTIDVANRYSWNTVVLNWGRNGELIQAGTIGDNGWNSPGTPQDYYLDRWNYSSTIASNKFHTNWGQYYQGAGNIFSYLNNDRVSTWMMPIFDSAASSRYDAYGLDYTSNYAYNPINNYSGTQYTGYKAFNFPTASWNAVQNLGLQLNSWDNRYSSVYYDFSTMNRTYQPIIVDLDGDGIDIDLLSGSKALFDLEADGKLYHTAWAGADDGLLVIDLNSEGGFGADNIIDQARELNFTLWTNTNSNAHNSDLKSLAEIFDTDNNGFLDKNDAHFGEFRIWQDKNGDGITQYGELKTLIESDIQSLNLLSTDKTHIFADGTTIQSTSNYINSSGENFLIADVSFAYDELSVGTGDPSWSVNIKRANGDYVVAYGAPHPSALIDGTEIITTVLDAVSQQDIDNANQINSSYIIGNNFEVNAGQYVMNYADLGEMKMHL